MRTDFHYQTQNDQTVNEQLKWEILGEMLNVLSFVSRKMNKCKIVSIKNNNSLTPWAACVCVWERQSFDDADGDDNDEVFPP